jgi:hypothetical protein
MLVNAAHATDSHDRSSKLVVPAMCQNEAETEDIER